MMSNDFQPPLSPSSSVTLGMKSDLANSPPHPTSYMDHPLQVQFILFTLDFFPHYTYVVEMLQMLVNKPLKKALFFSM